MYLAYLEKENHDHSIKKSGMKLSYKTNYALKMNYLSRRFGT